MPDLLLETPFLEQGHIVAGVDEAGRGPWAGPVVAAAAILDINHIPDMINDSKKLSASKRDIIYTKIMETADVGVGIASVEEIDSINILQATKLAMVRAIENLTCSPSLVLIDGNQPPTLIDKQVHAIIKGDTKSLSIAAASIIAKVTRDTLMQELAVSFPQYAWEKNAGYGTKKHQDGLNQHGVTEHHRRSFAPIRKLIECAS